MLPVGRFWIALIYSGFSKPKNFLCPRGSVSLVWKDVVLGCSIRELLSQELKGIERPLAQGNRATRAGASLILAKGQTPTPEVDIFPLQAPNGAVLGGRFDRKHDEGQ